MDSPAVSVCIVAYNHEAFIERCVRSVLDQQVDFAFEVIVGDDCSTDRTAEILEELAREDPRVRLLRYPRNVGPTQNLMTVHNAARGDLVAHLDGDDFCAPGKLKAQVETLGARPECVACGHRMVFVDEQGRPTGADYPHRLGPRVGLREAVRWGMPFLASSLMYRRPARQLTAAEFEVFDWYILTDLLKSGPAAYLHEPLGSYTVNTTSLTATLKRHAMRERMLGLYARRLSDEPELKSDIFCYAAAAALACVRLGDAVSRSHWDLLRKSFTLAAIPKLPDTILWRVGNLRALMR